MRKLLLVLPLLFCLALLACKKEPFDPGDNGNNGSDTLAEITFEVEQNGRDIQGATVGISLTSGDRALGQFFKTQTTNLFGEAKFELLNPQTWYYSVTAVINGTQFNSEGSITVDAGDKVTRSVNF